MRADDTDNPDFSRYKITIPRGESVTTGDYDLIPKEIL
jgi:hypothetical protein